MLKVRYVGLKDKEVDCVAGTGVTWIGHGDVQSVPAKAWAIMAKHPDVWDLVEGEDDGAGLSDAAASKALAEREKALNEWGSQLDSRERELDAREAAVAEREKAADKDDGKTDADPADPFAGLYGMNTEALRKYAKEHTPEVAAEGMKGQALRAAIIEALKAKA